MDTDLLMLAEFGESLDPPAEGPPADLRRRVLTGTRSPRRWPSLSPGSRLAWQLGGAGVVATAVIAIAGAGLLAGPPTHVADPAPPSPVIQPGDPAQVLILAAQHTEHEPELRARPDQFLLVESNVQQRPLTGGSDIAVPGPQLTRSWQSVDGTHDGLTRYRPLADPTAAWVDERLPGCRDGRFAPTLDRPQHTEPCTPNPAYRADLPTDPVAMRAYLYRPDENHTGLPADQIAFDRVAEVLGQSLGSPEVQAAVYRAAAQIPGTTIIQSATDVAGRSGIAVARADTGIRTELIFDTATYRYLGTNRVFVDPAAAAALNYQGWHLLSVGQEAILRVAVVDRVGDLP
jgi:hypothetical protein